MINADGVRPQMRVDSVVIGAGIAGLVVACRLAQNGKRVVVLARGKGGYGLGPGSIDMVGKLAYGERTIQEPLDALDRLGGTRPIHPYAIAGRDRVASAFEWLKRLCEDRGYPLETNDGRNWWLPTAIGTFRPTFLAPPSVTAGHRDYAFREGAVVLVGLEGLASFSPVYAAANLRSFVAADCMVLTAEVPIPPKLRGQGPLGSDLLFRLVDWIEQRDGLDYLASRLEGQLGQVHREANRAGRSIAAVGIPAVLGWDQTLSLHAELQERIGVRVFEIPTLPPTMTGLRLGRVLERTASSLGVEIIYNSHVLGAGTRGRQVLFVSADTPVGERTVASKSYILATGGFAGGGLVTEDGRNRETVFGLPLADPDFGTWKCAAEVGFLPKAGHEFVRDGVRVDSRMRPIDEAGDPVLENVFLAGSIIAGSDPYWEKSVGGISLVTGYHAANSANDVG